MAVMMQAFYWDAPIKEQKEGEWWNFIAEKAEELGKVGDQCALAATDLQGRGGAVTGV